MKILKVLVASSYIGWVLLVAPISGAHGEYAVLESTNQLVETKATITPDGTPSNSNKNKLHEQHNREEISNNIENNENMYEIKVPRRLNEAMSNIRVTVDSLWQRGRNLQYSWEVNRLIIELFAEIFQAGVTAAIAIPYIIWYILLLIVTIIKDVYLTDERSGLDIFFAENDGIHRSLYLRGGQ